MTSAFNKFNSKLCVQSITRDNIFSYIFSISITAFNIQRWCPALKCCQKLCRISFEITSHEKPNCSVLKSVNYIGIFAQLSFPETDGLNN